MSRHRALPISLYVSDRRAVVVGDGPAAARRADQLADAGAAVERVTWAEFSDSAVAGAHVVAVQPEHGADTSALPIADAIAAARAAGALTYVADDRAHSDFAMPGIAQRGPVKLAVSTDGVAPALTRRLKDELQRLLDDAGEDIDALVDALAASRAALPREGRADILFKRACRARFDGRLIVDRDSGPTE